MKWRDVAASYAADAIRAGVGDHRFEQAINRLLEAVCVMWVEGPRYRLPSGRVAASARGAIRAWLRKELRA